MNKKVIIITVVGVAVVALTLFTILFLKGEDSWICENNEWVKRGNPKAPKPTEPCGKVKRTDQEQAQENKIDAIKVNQPQPGDSILSPLIIEGEARGWWFFEADFPVRLEDANGEIITKGIAQAEGDWMTEDFVPFKAELEFNLSTSTEGTLILEKDNPSGLPENALEKRIPVKIKADAKATTKVKVFFGSKTQDPKTLYCEKTYSVERVIKKTKGIARAALTELLAGPTEEEKTKGYFTSINTGVTINSLVIENGVAKVDFDERLEYQVGGSCLVATIRSQIIETLKQFPTVGKVIISVNGRTEDILQP